MKRMKEKLKLWFVILLCNVVAKFYGEYSFDGFLHDINFDLLDEKDWNIRKNEGSILRVARLKKYGLFGLCLFEKKKEVL